MTKGMERKVSEVIDINGIKLRVKEAEKRYSCNGGYFKKYLNSCLDEESVINCMNRCCGIGRSDSKNVVFVEVKQ